MQAQLYPEPYHRPVVRWEPYHRGFALSAASQLWMCGMLCAAPTHPPLLDQSPILFRSAKCPAGCAFCRPANPTVCVACDEGKGLVNGVCTPCAASNVGCAACPNDITKVRLLLGSFKTYS